MTRRFLRPALAALALGAAVNGVFPASVAQAAPGLSVTIDSARVVGGYGQFVDVSATYTCSPGRANSTTFTVFDHTSGAFSVGAWTPPFTCDGASHTIMVREESQYSPPSFKTGNQGSVTFKFWDPAAHEAVKESTELVLG